MEHWPAARTSDCANIRRLDARFCYASFLRDQGRFDDAIATFESVLAATHRATRGWRRRIADSAVSPPLPFPVRRAMCPGLCALPHNGEWMPCYRDDTLPPHAAFVNAIADPDRVPLRVPVGVANVIHLAALRLPSFRAGIHMRERADFRAEEARFLTESQAARPAPRRRGR